ncbi:GNAT family N-acetyltransferase [Saccharomonospora sp. NPDC046836]|uniref:GNAT family N-acetyltransferase n=1 Tax=Saccharomonospora sp. NPDC046836 TaxID=3156921 RepID=UPI0033D607F6
MNESLCRGVTVREATERDAELLLGWRNDPDTRRWSRSTEAVEPAQHLRWLRGVLDSPDRLLFVAEHGAAVGTVRFDRLPDAERTWEVSITVAPEHRGRGLAGAILAAGEQALHRLHAARSVLASVHEGNAASLALFHRAGYADMPATGPFRLLSKALEDR